MVVDNYDSQISGTEITKYNHYNGGSFLILEEYDKAMFNLSPLSESLDNYQYVTSENMKDIIDRIQIEDL